MARQFTLYGADLKVHYTRTLPDSSLVLTAVGSKQADQIQACDFASRQINGLDSDGHVTYTCIGGGTIGNAVKVSHTVGGVGGPYANRPLAVSVNGLNIAVVFATDSNGDTVVPTAQEVVDLIEASAEATSLVTVAIGGDGSGGAGEAAAINLAGGLDNGDCLKFLGQPNVCRYVNKVSVV